MQLLDLHISHKIYQDKIINLLLLCTVKKVEGTFITVAGFSCLYRGLCPPGDLMFMSSVPCILYAIIHVQPSIQDKCINWPIKD